MRFDYAATTSRASAIPAASAASVDSARAVERAATPRPRMICAMSGGVDSAVAAVLLQEQGYDVVGVHMATSPYATGDHARKFGSCCSPRDSADARAVAIQRGFPFYNFDLVGEFREAVIAPFVDDYLHGRTPNPCVLCNNKLKLGHLLDRADTLGAEGVATGHYARCDFDDDLAQRVLRRPRDRAKDQTYYLFGLTRRQVQRFRCPLGDLPKSDVRELARRAGIAVHDKPDSQEICFVPTNNYRDFLAKVVPDIAERVRPGAIVDLAGNVLGAHTGTPHYTIGQRRGLGIGGGDPLYVLAIDVDRNVVVVGPKGDLLRDGLRASRANWQIEPSRVDGAERLPDGRLRLRCRAQIRYRSEGVLATLVVDEAAATFDAAFDDPQMAVTPGQACALYDAATGETLLGGGWIDRPLTDEEAAGVRA